jgi:RimJ/RimL family protein N-acetyltransferase
LDKNMKVYLETDRIILREFEAGDENYLLDLNSDPEVMRYISDGVPSLIDEDRAALGRVQQLYAKHDGRLGNWIALEKSSKEFMGWFHFRPSKSDPENTKRIELGYRLKKKFWGKSYGTEGSRALIAKGFDELGVEEVFAVTMKGNRASQKVMEKAGLSFSKNYHCDEFPGAQKEAVEYSILKQDWTTK